MKLVSVWIENYMKIQNLGFNLGDSEYFRFEYEETQNLLRIKSEPTNDYFDLFKNSSINNISGILGVNGAGKTTFLKALQVVVAEKPISSSLVIIIKDEATGKYEIRSYTHFMKREAITIEVDDSVKYLLKKAEQDNTYTTLKPFHDFNILYYSNLYSEQNDLFIEHPSLINRSVDYQTRVAIDANRTRLYLNQFKKEGKETLEKLHKFNILRIYFAEKSRRLLTFLAQVKNVDKGLEHIIKPVRFPKYIRLNFREDIYDRARELSNNSDYDFKTLSQVIERAHERILKDNDPSSRFRKEFILKLFLFAFHDDLFQQVRPKRVPLEDLSSFVNQLNTLNGDVFESILMYMQGKTNKKWSHQITRLEHIYNRIRDDHYKDKIEFDHLPFDLYSYKIDISESSWELIHDIQELQEYEDEPLVNIRWNYPLSSGEEAILNQLAELKIGWGLRNPSKSLIVVIDEGELYLHPEWQRIYVSTLFDFFEYLNSKEEVRVPVQIVLTSHSPFIASDIPKFNLIFLDKTPKDTLDDYVAMHDSQTHLSTFGENIFNLFKNSFYLSSLFGEFSKRWIEEAFAVANGKQSKLLQESDLPEFISLVGENVLREMLKNKLRFRVEQDETEIINLTEKARKKEKLIKQTARITKKTPTKKRPK
jgi:hypothetical protein